MKTMLLSTIAGVMALTLASTATAQDAAPLVVGSDFGVAPWMVRGANGPEGFGVDLINAVGEKIGRPKVEITDVNFSGLFAALFAGRIDITVNPLNITKDRSEKMLFSEPIFATGNGFIVAKGDKIGGFEDLKGKAIAVNRGTLSDTWATANAEKYGFEVQRYDTFPDSVQAVLTRRAFSALNEIPTTVYAASKNPMIEVAFKDFDGRKFGYAFRNDDQALRNKVEDAIECLKKEGVLVALYEKWYNEKPAADSPLSTVYPGYGAPDFTGYDATPHELACK
ncbi:ABC transporter substrate-binding protein [Rhizobium sp. SSA_523]|uniref:substrate-binding periplasmic protein n=1 Tax=Rhizobium sp. SSA_523 TaxID=2952477 RepID=UPI0020913947|nr:ABC transporter substrate-binding protein [Rhizobium sp. SSA_523]MCO5731370.1 ABC transporter substrate-binding protein [Rhizobium sp. SSA_523]WKC22104.1 ABC transporter substrate-binding protein [Rhizobium sp. SSA_523]